MAANALKELAHMQLGIDNIKKAQKELDTSTMEGRVTYEAYGQQIKANTKLYQAKQKEIQIISSKSL
ncbi:MAG: hypothetical protein RRY23_03290 [Alistipes sp.]